MRIVLLGAPGSGKGTQAKLLAARQGLAHISTGDLLRAAVAEGSELGNKVKAVLDAGELVSDDLMLDLLRDRLSQSDCGNGFILDGYPRNAAQAKALDALLVDIRADLDRAVLINVDEGLLIKRLTGRLTCGDCGAVFNVHTNPPKQEGVCDACGSSNLQHRSDDTEETVSKRLAVYREQTRPVIDYYADRDQLARIDGEGSLESVQERMLAALAATAQQ